MKSDAEAKNDGTEPQVPSGKPKRKRGRVLLTAVIVVIVVGMAAAAYLFLLKPGPDQIVRKYLAATATGNVESLRPLLAKSSAAMLPSPEEVKKTPHTPQTLPDMEIGQAQIQGATATVPVKIKAKTQGFGMPEQTLDIVLVKESGQWKIDLMATMQKMYEKALGGAMPPGHPGTGGAPPGPAPPAGAAPAPEPAPPAQAAPPPPPATGKKP